MNTEARIQSECFKWFWNQYPGYRRLMFHIPNGGKRTAVEAARFKAMGVVAGVPDLFLALPGNGYHGMFIEVKKPGEKPRPEQKKQMALFAQNRYYCVYIDSVELFEMMIKIYLNGTEPG